MWFESEFHFNPRLDRALEKLAIDEAEQRRKEEELAKKVAEQLEARRLEAQAKPQKVVPQAKKKEKKAVVRLDPKDLFVLPPQGAEAYDEPQVDNMILADVHVEGDEDLTDP